MVRRRLSRHLIVLVMLSLAGLGWLAQASLGISWLEGPGSVETPALPGLWPGALLMLLAALFDGYRTRQRALLARECARSERAMAIRAAREVNEPLTLIIANLEMTVGRMHPSSDGFAVLDPARDAAWHILDRLRSLTELTDLPREEVGALPSLLQVIEGRSIPTVDDPPPLAFAAGSRPRTA